jgi:hypothetical protein
MAKNIHEKYPFQKSELLFLNTLYRYAATGEGFGCMWPEVAVLLAASTMWFIDSHFVILPDIYQICSQMDDCVPDL